MLKNLFSIILITIATLSAMGQTAAEYAQIARNAKVKLEFTEALKNLGKAIELEPTNPTWYVNRGDVYFTLERWSKARADFDKAASVDSLSCAAYLGRSAYFRQVNEPDSAMINALKAKSLADKIWMKSKVETELGEVLVLQEKDSLARIAFGESLALDSTNIVAHKRLAALLALEDDYAGANTHLIQAYKYDRRDLETLINLAYTANKIGNYPGAITYSNLALQLDPLHPVTLSNKAYAQLQIGDVEAALKDIRKSLANDNANAWAQVIAGQIYLAKKEPSKACKYFEKAEKLGFDNADAEYVAARSEAECDSGTK